MNLTPEEIIEWRRRQSAGSVVLDSGELTQAQVLAQRPRPSGPEQNPEELRRLEIINSQSRNDKFAMHGVDFYEDAIAGTTDFFENLGNAWGRRRQMAAEITQAYAKDEQGLPHTVIQIIGKVGVGAAFDLMGEILISGATAVVSDIPDEIKDPVKKSVAEAGIAFMNTDMGKEGMEALADGVESYQVWKQENPVHARTFEGIVNIGLAATMPFGPKGGFTPSSLGQALRAWASHSEKTARRKAATSITQPRLTKRQYAESVVAEGRTKQQGLMRHRVDQLSRRQAASVDELMKVPLKPRASYQKNFEIIGDAVNKIDNQLKKVLKRIKTGASQADINNMHAAAKLRVQNSPTLAGNPLASLAQIEKKVNQELAKHGRTPYGILKTRRAVDAWLGQWKQGKRLSDDSASALQTAIDAYRTAMNQTIAKLAPNQKVTESLARMAKLMDARDAMHLKIAFENRNMVTQAYGKVMGVVTARFELVGLTAAALGTTYMAASGMVAPLMLSVPLFGLGWIGTRAAISPNTRRAIAKLIDLTKSTAKLTDQTRIERIYLQQLLDETASPIQWPSDESSDESSDE